MQTLSEVCSLTREAWLWTVSQNHLSKWDESPAVLWCSASAHKAGLAACGQVHFPFLDLHTITLQFLSSTSKPHWSSSSNPAATRNPTHLGTAFLKVWKYFNAEEKHLVPEMLGKKLHTWKNNSYRYEAEENHPVMHWKTTAYLMLKQARHCENNPFVLWMIHLQ